MSESVYIITGAAGHLGGTIVRELRGSGAHVRGLFMPNEPSGSGVERIEGDVRDRASLEPLFSRASLPPDADLICIHTAGIVDISGDVTPLMRDVNVGGTRNIVDLCAAHGVKRLVYVSSVHAIPEDDPYRVLQEVDAFDAGRVVGGYAKTKAEATAYVLEAARQGRVDAVVVHPSGILGPYDVKSGNHLVQMVSDYLRGKLPACVRGGYDFVDVRDVAQGCIAAAACGTSGECYILSNRHYEVKEVLAMLRAIAGGRRLVALPMWLVRCVMPFISLDAKRRKRRPLYTKYSLQTLTSNDRFSHDKATRELGYQPRDLYQTLRDTVAWVRRGRVERALA